jgi:iron complex outermembrane receptor protein
LSELSLEAIMMKKLLRLATLAVLFTGVASAQSTGSITGVVTDGATGKPVVGALVVATSPAVPGQQTAVTDAKGSFTVAGLPAGQYKLQASFDGYKPETRSDLALGENVALRANLAIVPEAVQLEEVVVTGSRIKRKDLTTPAPVSVVTKEAMTAIGKVSLSEFLQAMPEQQGGLNAQVNNGTDGSTSVNLRNIGSQRTLVLVNGRRMVGGNASGVVDVSAIPQAAVERVEILKDGASAIYGSDAIGGVVNVILKKRFNGTEVSGYMGGASRGDGKQYDASFTTGSGSDKGNFIFSVGATKMDSVLAMDRDYSKESLVWGPFQPTPVEGWVFGNGSGTSPNGRFSLNTGLACPGAVAGTELAQACTAAGYGTGTPPYAGTRTMQGVATGPGTATYQRNPATSYNTNPTNYLITPSERIQLFASGDGNIANVARPYFEATFTKRRSAQTLAPMPLTNASIPTAPIAVSASSMYNPFGVNILSWRRRTMEFGDRYWKNDAENFRTVAGVDGSLGEWAGPLRGWTWDLSFNYGSDFYNRSSSGELRMPNVANAVGPSMLYGGVPICVRVPGDPTTKINGCVPMDVLHGNGNLAGVGSLQALKTYVSYDGLYKGTQDQRVIAANFGGELTRLMSDRPAALSFGLERRWESGSYQPDAFSMALESSGNNQLPTRGSFDVTEYYAELSLPVINKVPFVEELELSLAARGVKYSNFGNNGTYKVGGRYTPVKDVTIRGTYSTALRAPDVGDLYGGTADSYDFITDPCRTLNAASSATLVAQCTAHGGWTVANGGSGDFAGQMLVKYASNAELKPETAKIITAGVVVEPRWVPNLSLTVDYYKIMLQNAIDTFGSGNTLAACYREGNEAYCPMIHRDPITGYISQVDVKTGNFSKQEVAGVDMSARYALATGAFGKFNFGLDATYLINQDRTDATGFIIKGAGNDDTGAKPKWKALFGAAWSLEGFNLGTNVRYVGGFKECNTDYCMNNPDPTPDAVYNVPSYTTVNLNGGYTYKSKVGTTSLIVGCQNVADKQPNKLAFGSNPSNSTPYLYDYVGRFFYTRLTQTF